MRLGTSFVVTILAAITFATSAMAAAEIKATYKVSAAELWNLVEFNQPAENIMPPIESSKLMGSDVGARKLLKLNGGGEIMLQLVHFDAKSMAFNYIIQSSPLPLENYVGRVRVKDLGNGSSQLVWKAVFDPKGVEQSKADETVQGFLESIAGRIGEKFPKQ